MYGYEPCPPLVTVREGMTIVYLGHNEKRAKEEIQRRNLYCYRAQKITMRSGGGWFVEVIKGKVYA